jgi:dihydrofolate reductase
MRHNLVDTYMLMVHPIVLGTGRRLFPEGSPMSAFQLVSTKTTASGVVIATYTSVEPSVPAGPDKENTA